MQAEVGWDDVKISPRSRDPADERMIASRKGPSGQKQPRGSESNIDKHLPNTLLHANGRWAAGSERMRAQQGAAEYPQRFV
jgi:hypothetical protein